MSANRASNHESSDVALRGQIDAIGIFDLLRVAVAQRSTGRLHVFNEAVDADLHYEQGRLVAVVGREERGAVALSMVLRLEYGEFEYVRGSVAERVGRDARLHEILLLALKRPYIRGVDSKCNEKTPNRTTSFTSGVHPIAGRTIDPDWPDPEPSANGTLAVEPSALPWTGRMDVVPVSKRSMLAYGELARATADGTGRLLEATGPITNDETTKVAKIAKIAGDLASLLGYHNLERLEIQQANRALLCRPSNETLRIARVNDSPDLPAVWQGLKP